MGCIKPKGVGAADVGWSGVGSVFWRDYRQDLSCLGGNCFPVLKPRLRYISATGGQPFSFRPCTISAGKK